MKINISLSLLFGALLFGGCSATAPKFDHTPLQDKNGQPLLKISGIYGNRPSEPTGREGMEGQQLSEAQVEFNKSLALLIRHMLNEHRSSSLTGVLGSFASTAKQNAEAVNTQVVTAFQALQERQAAVEVLVSNHSLPEGIVSWPNEFTVQKGYRHQWLGCFILVTEPKAVGDVHQIIGEAKWMTAAAGGDFVFLPALIYDEFMRWQELGGCSFKLDPRVKRKLMAQVHQAQEVQRKKAAAARKSVSPIMTAIPEIINGLEVK